VESVSKNGGGGYIFLGSCGVRLPFFFFSFFFNFLFLFTSQHPPCVLGGREREREGRWRWVILRNFKEMCFVESVSKNGGGGYIFLGSCGVRLPFFFFSFFFLILIIVRFDESCGRAPFMLKFCLVNYIYEHSC
jgi:hypothetical protein